jgi:two-component system LytT family response regulator
MIRTILIDDENNALEVLEILLKKYCPNLEILEKCNGGKAGIDAIEKHQPDLVFLDIEMPHINGFDVLTATKNYKYKVIFTTAYNQFAIKAFKFSAIDYLLKPIDFEELKEAVNKISSSENHTTFEENLQKLMSQLQKPKEKRIALPVNHSLQFFDFDEIIRIEKREQLFSYFLDG